MNKLLSFEEAFAFYNNSDFLTKNELTEEMLPEKISGYYFLGTLRNSSIIACTAFKQVGDRTLEVHTYVLPEERTGAIIMLTKHMEHFKELGAVKLITTATPLVKNFLVKRLGFTVCGESLEHIL